MKIWAYIVHEHVCHKYYAICVSWYNYFIEKTLVDQSWWNPSKISTIGIPNCPSGIGSESKDFLC